LKKPILLYGLLGGVLIALLQAIEYRYLVVEHSLEIYGGLVALVFVTLGIWLGLRLTGRPERVVVKEVSVPAPSSFVRNDAKLDERTDDANAVQVGLESRRSAHPPLPHGAFP
jgi:NarL family two-component system response regulator LiaR